MEGKEFNVTVALDQRLGQDGKSAYELWKEQGNEGSVADFLAKLKGEPGKAGKSAYELWVEQGNTGSVADYLAKQKGEQGDAGKSTYDLWKEAGNEGSMSDFLAKQKGEQGDAGKSTYDLWKEAGNERSMSEFLAAQKGEKGDTGKVTTRTITLESTGWDPAGMGRISVAVDGVTAESTIIVSPAPDSVTTYGKCGVYAAAQEEGRLTFACAMQPQESLTVNIVIL